MPALFGYSGPLDSALSRTMSTQLDHRGKTHKSLLEQPHGTVGYQSDDDDESWLGSGLFESHDGRTTIAISGHLLSKVDLMSAYREHGMAFVERLTGAFVIAVIDDDTLYLARDGSGLRTIYYGQHAKRLFFAVEPKAVLAVPGFPRQLRSEAVAQYLTFSFVPGGGTMLEDLHELPAGHWLEFKAGNTPRLHRWFRFEDAEAELDNGTDWPTAFRQLHAEAVSARVPKHEPMGVFLSGGLDSSVVVAELAAQGHKHIPTYAIHFGPQYKNELSFARMVAKRCQTEHHEILIEPRDFLPRIREVVWHMDEPIGDPITLPNFELARRVRKDLRWVFNGEGGDPCFGGPKNLTMMLHHWYGGVERPADFREKAYLASYRRAYREIPHLLSESFRSSFEEDDALAGVLRPFLETQQIKSFLHKLLAINIRLKGAHLILPKVERMLGASGVTPLSPLFDERIVRMSFAMPPNMKIRAGIEKVVIKEAYKHLLPEEIIQRPKSGMRVPVHFWFKGELQKYARSILSPRQIKKAGIFNPERVEQLLNYNISEGPGRYGIRLWMLLTFEIWRRLVIEGETL